MTTTGTSKPSLFQTLAYQTNHLISPPAPVKRLLRFRLANGEQKQAFDDKALRLIAKHLKRDEAVAQLESILTQKNKNSQCLLVSKSFGFSSLHFNRKISPHYLTCRLFRWPELKSAAELQPIVQCESRDGHICINPYHYGRTNSVPSPVKVMVPRRSTEGEETDPSVSPALSPSLAMSPSQLSQWDSATTDGRVDGEDEMETETNGENHHEFTFVPYEELGHWCSISYYEMQQRVGEQYEAVGSSITIDGYTDPSNSSRFCLGLLSNVNRTPEIESIRRHIGKGVKLYYLNGEVFAECLGKNPVFVQSPNCNARYGWHPATVCKIPPGCNLKIFANDEFAKMLHSSVPQGYETVFQLQRMCIIRMSFVKGWGREYRRQTITSTPCWIEIHLCNPLKWLDAVLQRMNGPDFTIHSNT